MRNPEERAAAFGMYLKGGYTLPQIAAAKNVPYSTANSWHELGHWPAKRREALIQANETAEERFARERELILDGELTIGRMAREIVSGELRKILKANNPEPMKVSDAARLAKIVEATRKWGTESEGKPVCGTGNRVRGSLIQVGLKPLGKLPPKTIDATAAETTCPSLRTVASLQESQKSPNSDGVPFRSKCGRLRQERRGKQAKSGNGGGREAGPLSRCNSPSIVIPK